MDQATKKDELFHEIDNHRKTLKITCNVLWIVIVIVGFIGTGMFFHIIGEMQEYSKLYDTTQTGTYTNKFGEVIQKKPGVTILITEKGETIENVEEWAKKNYFKNLWLGLLFAAITVVIIAFLVRLNKKLMKKKVHMEFKLEKLKHEGIEAAEEFERRHPLK
ncbi:hypothetical protein KAU33_12455 [Candidatus Dependentiae bacterium]|nr:hypothetical protein [Candidatus Dependentiae bacterium]